MRTRNRKLTWLHRLGTWVLLVALVCALPLSALADGGNFKIAEEVQPKPVVTLQGNLVVENNRLTGFFELALMVRSGRTITDDSGAVITEAQYAALPEADQLLCSFQYFPFESAAASTFINVDALTAVGWDIQEVEYETWTGTGGVGSYAAADTGLDGAAHGYGRGIVSANQSGDPKQITDFPVQDADLNGLGVPPVGLESAGPDEAGTRNAYIEHYDKDNKAALLTLSAETRANTRVVYEEDTPVVVVRFAYDRKRFPNATVGKNGFSLWGGVDPAEPGSMGCGSDETALFYLGSSDAGWGGSLEKSDQLVADGSVGVSVYYQAGVTNPSKPNAQNTHFYYYLGADPVVQVENTTAGRKFYVEGESAQQEAIYPKTASELAVLTAGNVPGIDLATGKYSFFINLLRRSDDTLVIQLVNAETYKKGTGTGGTQILFYDWDDSLIGALIVGGGDVRPQVNQYIEENLVHPDLRTAGLLANMGGNLPDYSTTTPGAGTDEERYQKVLDSVERQYTYRGKYPSVASPAGATGPDIVTDGKEYPLTNKLDYAFYRHINTVTTLEYTDGVSGETIQEKYVTTEPISKNAEANQYPWVYGWAVVEDNSEANYKDWQVRRDAAKVEDVWTTVGVGELSNVKPSSVQGVPTAGPGGETATVTVEYPEFVNAAGTGVVPTDYAFKVSDSEGNGYLHFADFSDIDGELERLEQANAGSAETMAKDKNVLIVKAVYEPGASLMVGGQYQMIQEPYYNKFNDLAASKGGAYSVEITLERAAEELGLLRGVNRVREPAVRQDTTVDQKWIQDNALGVDHNLDNADVKTAKGLTETTFTKIDADNGEEITFTLSLSARQNKVDYFLMEAYGLNFVAGGQRSVTNYNREGSAHTLDNYNYYTDDSNTNDLYHDVTKYDERDGSHGYVLYGSLHYLMTRATMAKRGDISGDDFSKSTDYEVLMDANLRTDSSGTQPTPITVMNVIEPKLLDAARDCINNKTADVWNYEKDCAELSYHQLQYYILGDPIWTNRAAADAKPLAWCHLHASCAAAVSGKPKDWSELVTYAKDSDKADGIGDLLPGEIETISGLRKANGAQYTTGAEFKTDVVAAVNAGCESWVEIQYYILHKMAPVDKATALAEAKTSYWWYDKSTNAPSTPGNLTALIKTTDEYFTEATLPDGSKETEWTTRLERGEKNFDANNDGDNSTVANGWKNMTQNLVAKRNENPDGSEDTEKFADWDTFKDELLRVVTIARTANVTPASDKDYWYKLQYLILHSGETAWPTVTVGDGSTEGDEMSGYWWHNGGTHLFINNLQSMLNVAALVNDGDEAAKSVWDKFKLADFQKCTDMTDWSLNFTGTDDIDNFEIDGSTTPEPDEFDNFKDKILALSKFGANNTWFDLDGSTNANLWKDVQFWLLHEESEVKPGVASTEHQYYWWEDEGTPKPVTLEGKRGNVQSWLNAAFMEVYNGNTVAWDNLSGDGADGSDSKFNATRLRNPAAADVTPGNTTYQTPDEIPMLAATDIKTKLNAMIVEIMTGKTGHAAHRPPSTITWYQVQDYLITGTYTDAPTAEQTAAWEKQYWWLAQDENPDKKQEEVDTSALDTFIAKYLYPTNNVASITNNAMLTTSINPGDLNFKKTTGGVAFTAPPFLNMARNRLNALLTAASGAGQDLSTLTWYQIQWALLDDGNGAYLTPNQAYHKLKDTATWAPDWVKKLPEPPAPEVLNKFIADYLYPTNNISKLTTAATLTSNSLGDLTFKKTMGGVAFTAPPFLTMARNRLNALLTAASGAGQDLSTLTWYQIQWALLDDGNGAYLSPADAYNKLKSVSWAPPTATTAPVPEGAEGVSLSGEFEEVPEEELTPEQRMVEIENAIAEQEEIIRNAQERIEALQRLLQQLRNDLLWDNTEETESPGRAEASTTVETPETVEDPEENEPGEPPGERIERPTDVREEIPAGEEFIITVAKGLRRTLL